MSGRNAKRLAVSSEQRGGVTVVAPSGEIDLATADELASALDHGRRDGSALVLDLRRVPFMDSSGLAVVMRVVERLGARFAVVLEEGSPVERLFDLTGVLESLGTFRDPGAAVAAAGSGARE